MVTIGAGSAIPGVLLPVGEFAFQDGQGAASASEFVANHYSSGATAGSSVSTTIRGIGGAAVESFDTTEFVVVRSSAQAGVLGGIQVGSPPATTGGLVCAYAFVTTGIPSAGTMPVPGAPRGCDANLPKVGSAAPSCGGGAGTVAVVDLLHGTTTASLLGVCHIPAGSPSGTVVLYLSYAIVATELVAAVTLPSITFVVAL